jgi:hypothetical protein
MKIVISTQLTENYGSHDWDGLGVCPQHWKNKGYNTYILSNIDINKAKCSQYWDALYKAMECVDDDYSKEYIRDGWLVDEQEFNVLDYCEAWEKPVSLLFDGTKITYLNKPEGEM